MLAMIAQWKPFARSSWMRRGLRRVSHPDLERAPPGPLEVGLLADVHPVRARRQCRGRCPMKVTNEASIPTIVGEMLAA
jgi:hypothetical protein